MWFVEGGLEQLFFFPKVIWAHPQRITWVVVDLFLHMSLSTLSTSTTTTTTPSNTTATTTVTAVSSPRGFFLSFSLLYLYLFFVLATTIIDHLDDYNDGHLDGHDYHDSEGNDGSSSSSSGRCQQHGLETRHVSSRRYVFFVLFISWTILMFNLGPVNVSKRRWQQGHQYQHQQGHSTSNGSSTGNTSTSSRHNTSRAVVMFFYLLLY